MEKVKITQEQADAFEKLIRNTHIKFKYAIETARNQEWATESFTPLNGLSFDKFINVIRYGYEVEPEFKVGDWVAYNYWGLVGKVVSTDGGIALDNRVNGKLNPNDFKHATPQEIATEKTRRWWNKNNRYEWELMKGDIIRNFVINGTFYEVTYVDGEYIGLFDIGRSRMETEEIDIVSGGYRVVCFADHRKDI